VSATPQRYYRFATADQWKAVLFERVDVARFDRSGAIAPLAPYALPPRVFTSNGAAAPAGLFHGEALWRDDAGRLFRAGIDDAAAHAFPAPHAIAVARRIAATRTSLWVADGPHALACFDADGLDRRFTVDLAGSQVVDVAGDGADGVWVLYARAGRWHCVHVDCAGVIGADFELDDTRSPRQLAFLRNVNSIVVRVERAPELRWFTPGASRDRLRVALSAIRPCFTATHFASDQRARLLVAGVDGAPLGGDAHAISLDGDGNALQTIELPVPASGLAATRDALLVTTGQGLLRYAAATSQSVLSAAASCSFVTPALQSPLNADPRRWLRIEALASLPTGTALEVSYATSSDPGVRDEVERIAGDASVPAARRVSQLRAYLKNWQSAVAQPGSDALQGDSAVPLAAPLFDVRDPYLWVDVRLIAAAGAILPAVRELRVLYPGHTLMEELPAIYQRQEAEPRGFLRALVGVLESSTQTLDEEIAALGRRIHPDTAAPPWMDYVARWMDLPWDDALSEAQKRAVMRRANQILSARGTRAGLEALLEALMPGDPRKFRVIDYARDYGFAMVGGKALAGSALPSVLAGLPSSALALGRKAFLGRSRLPCGAPTDTGLTGVLRHLAIHVEATAAERGAWEPWLADLVSVVVPANVRVRVRWMSPAVRARHDRLDGTLTLDDAPSPHLGTDAVIGLAQLPRDRAAKLEECGLEPGTRLQ
jgi:phage tail-like protein